MIPSPLSDPAAWDTLTIGGLLFTGKFKFDGDVLEKKTDTRHAAGRSGGRIRAAGYVLAKIKLVLSCYEDEHFEQLDAIVRLLFPRGGEPVRDAAFACPHPVLAIAGITEVYAIKMSSVEPNEVGDVYTTTIELVEYRPTANRPTAHVVRQRPDIAANNPTAFTGLDPVPPSAAPARPNAPSRTGSGPQPD